MYTIEELGPYEGFDIDPLDIGPDGRVVGVLHAPNRNDDRAFLWDPWQKVQPLAGATPSEARAINTAGVIVGASGAPLQAVRWDGGVATALPAVSGQTTSFCHDINDSNVIGGGAWKPGPESFAHIWYSATAQTTLAHDLGGNWDEVLALNNHSDVQAAGSYQHGGFLWSASSGMVALQGIPSSLNDHGITVGRAGTRAVRWTGLSMAQLDLLPPYGASEAFDVNDSGEIVGQCSYTGVPYPTQACIWRRTHGFPPRETRGELLGIPIPLGRRTAWFTSVEALSALIDPSLGWDLQTAKGINDRGQITGTGFFQGRPAAYRMTPPDSSGSMGWSLVAAVINILVGGRLGDAGVGLGPQGPEPIPPHGPERDLMIVLLISQLAGRMAHKEGAAILRRTALEELVRNANRMLEETLKGTGNP